MSLNNANILIVDDEKVVRDSCKRILHGKGYIISEAENAEEALRMIEKYSYDLVLTDIRLPGMDGIELLQKIKESYPATEVIVITGYGSVDTAVKAMKLGAYDYIEKPFRPDELATLVERALERKSLREENIRLREEVTHHYIKNIVGKSKAIEHVFRLIHSVAPTSSTVLIIGESGTGKELVAKAIHYNSPRRDNPFVVVDCGTLPKDLIEAELFGYRKGAFTGATSDKRGLIEEADGGTIFLDEIGELPLSVQSKLLRVLQEKEFRPIGDKRPKKVDVRFIAATNRDLEQLVRDGVFREDLYYRLNIFPIKVPPLRQRKEDIPILSYHFLRKHSEELGKDVKSITAEAMKLLLEYNWPGNVRELENTIQRAILLTTDEKIKPEDLTFLTVTLGHNIPQNIQQLKETKKRLRKASVEEVERLFVLDALRRADWNVSRAAKDVGMQRPNFHALMKKHGIRRPE